MPKKTLQSETQRIPKLRFVGFSGGWEDKKLENISKVNPSTEDLPNEFIYIDLESVDTGILKQEKRVKKNEAPSRAQRVLQKNDILFQTVRPYQQNNLLFNLNGNYVASTGYAQIRAKDSSMFLYQYLHTSTFLNKVLARCTGSNYPAINSIDVKKIKVSFPSSLEQQKIASFLGSTDELINNLKEQKENLESYKKGMMQKIFSQEIRFKDEKGKEFPKWEKKKLKQMDILVSDGNYGEMYPKASEMIETGVPFIRANNINNLRIIWNDMKYINKELHNVLTSGHLETGDILVTTRGDIGMLAYVDKEFNNSNINAQICLLRCGKNISPKFLLNYLASSIGQRQFKELQTGSALKQLPKGNLAKIIINYPSLLEQQKIADFLTSIDKLLESKQNQITEAEQWKKGLMQGLFV